MMEMGLIGAVLLWEIDYWAWRENWFFRMGLLHPFGFLDKQMVGSLPPVDTLFLSVTVPHFHHKAT